ncbi:MAG: hypothetical protein GF381_00890, partial [Candidatus Pacebacteria bacterium]|nr:hypothetical protein [Candidatus Paceibacterota bacterium]
MKDINFLKKQNTSLSQVSKKDQLLFRRVLIGFTGLVVLFTLAVAANFYLELRLKSLNKQIEAVKSTIQSQEPIEAKYLFFVNKLKIIRELFDLRSDKQAAINYFTNLFGPEIIISGIT